MQLFKSAVFASVVIVMMVCPSGIRALEDTASAPLDTASSVETDPSDTAAVEMDSPDTDREDPDDSPVKIRANIDIDDDVITINRIPKSASMVMGESILVAEDEVINDDLVLYGGSADIRGTVTGDMVVFGGTCVISGTVKGSVVAFGGNAEVKDTAVIHGDLVNMGGVFDVADGARVDGTTMDAASIPFMSGLSHWLARAASDGQIETPEFHFFRWLNIVATIFWLVVTLFVALLLSRNVENAAGVMLEEPLKAVLVGFLFHAATLVLIFVFTVMVIGIPLIPLLVLFWFITGLVGVPVGFIALGKKLGAAVNRQINSVLVAAFLGLVVMCAIRWTPLFIGHFIWHMWAMAGIGAVLVSRFGTMQPWFRRRQPLAPPPAHYSTPHPPTAQSAPPYSSHDPGTTPADPSITQDTDTQNRHP